MSSSILSQETLSCPADLVPLPRSFVPELSEGAFIYDTLKDFLSGWGLDISKLFFSPGNRILRVFYMDFDAGAHALLHLHILKSEEQENELIRLQTYTQGGNPNLNSKNWNAYYGLETNFFFTSVDVPPPLQILDFNWRYDRIEPEKLFYTWLHIHIHITTSNQMWNQDALEKVFSLAPPVEIDGLSQDDYLKIYRGMSRRSQDAATAISWSSSPTTALNFANHEGKGTQLVIGEVKVCNIVVYRKGNYEENEVIVYPGSVNIIGVENMISMNQENFYGLTMSCLLEFMERGREALTLGYPFPANETDIRAWPELLQLFYVSLQLTRNVHDVTHILRVLLLTLIYRNNSKDALAQSDNDILTYFAMLHDIGRTNDEEDAEHGAASVELIRRKGIRLKKIALSKREFEMAHFIIKYHSQDDEKGERALREGSWSKREKDRVWHLYQICKDMDGLDRVRINNLDYRRLRTHYARQLPFIAGGLLKEDLIKLIREFTLL